MRKWLLYILLCLFLAFNHRDLKAQNATQDDILVKRRGVELLFIPAFAENNLVIGFSCQKRRKIEYVGTFTANAMFVAEVPHIFHLNFTFALNKFLSNKKTYIPFWARLSNNINAVDYEEGYFPNTLRFGIGSGIGKCWRISDRWGLRTDVGLGVQLNLTYGEYDFWRYFQYGFEKNYPEYHWPVMPAFRLKVNFVRECKAK